MTYIDGFVLAVPTKNKEAYKTALLNKSKFEQKSSFSR